MLYNLTGLSREAIEFIANCVAEKPFGQVESLINGIRAQIKEQDQAEEARQQKANEIGKKLIDGLKDGSVIVEEIPPNAEGGEQARTTLQQFKEAQDPKAPAVPTPLIRDLPQPDPAPEGGR